MINETIKSKESTNDRGNKSEESSEINIHEELSNARNFIVAEAAKSSSKKAEGEELKEVEEANIKINELKEKAEKELNNLEIDQQKNIDPLDYFKGDRDTMEKYFREIAWSISVGMPVEHSVVRVKQQNEIMEDLEKGVPVVVEAHKRHGKTSMLKSLGNEWIEKRGIAPLYIDLNVKDWKWKSMSSEKFNEEFGRDDIEAFVKYNFPNISQEEIEKEMGNNPFKALDNLMEKTGKQILLEIDEIFSVAKKNDGRLELLLQNIKNLKNIKVIIAWHPFDTFSNQAEVAFNGYKRTPIEPLTFDDTKILLGKPFKDINSDITFSDEAVQRIFDYTGGRPLDSNQFLAQLLGVGNAKAVLRMRYEKKDIDDFININNLNISEVYENIFPATCLDMKTIYNSDLNEKHKEIINLLVKSGGEIKTSLIDEKNASELIKLGFVTKNEINNTYKINGELLLNLFKEVVT